MKKGLLIMGIGNTIRGDDGVGIEAVRRLRGRIASDFADILETSESGFGLLCLMSGYERVILVDSIMSGGRIGNVRRFTLEGLRTGTCASFSHTASIPVILAWAQERAIPIPRRIIFYTIEIDGSDSFREGLSGEVESAIPRVIHLIEEELGDRGGSNKRRRREGSWRFRVWIHSDLDAHNRF